MNSENKISFIINFFYCIFAAAIFILSIKLIPLFWPFLTSLVLAYIFKSLARRFIARTRTAAAAAGILFYFTVFMLFWLAAAVLLSQLIEFSKKLPDFYNTTLLPYARHLSNRLLMILHRFAPTSALSLSELLSPISAATQELVAEISSYFLSKATDFLKHLPIFFIGFLFTIVSSFAVAMDYEKVTQFLMRQIPPKFRPLVFDIKNFLISGLFKLIKAYLLIMFVTFLELCIGLWALRIPSFWKYSAVISLLDILPLLGSGAVLIPWGIIELISGRSALGAGLLILYAFTVVVRNIIEPRIVGDSLGLHPAVALTSMFFGLKSFGLIGMLTAPIAVMLIRFLQQNQKLRLYR